MNRVQNKIVYPPGVKELNEDLSTDDLVRRLKECAQAFQNMNQDEDNSAYIPLSLHLASPFFMEHPSRDARLLVACCIADVFRVYAPDAPYKDPETLKNIFEFFIEQLKGLEDPKNPIFKRYFYLLENLSWVKSFNICLELEENQQIFCQLFTLMFDIISDEHSTKVKAFMLDLLCPLIVEADTISQELLDTILIQIIEPRKSHNKNAYTLAKDLLKRGASTLEPFMQAFFNGVLILNKSTSSLVSRVYDLIYELNSLCPSIMAAVLPQLEFKLKSNQEKERLDVTKLLARMFSDKDSDLANQNKPLWKCFLGRFNDISVRVRTRCVQYSMHFLLNHQDLRADIIDQLQLRQHDPEENVRYEVVMAIISAAKKDFSSVNDVLLNFVKERTLDKKFKIRKEALLGLAYLYKTHAGSTDLSESTLDCISWIKDKILHVYYQTALEDRMLVERILHTCLIPHQNPLEERMQKLYHLFATVDDNAVKAFIELLKNQCQVRSQFRAIVEYLQQPRSEERNKNILIKLNQLSKNLPQNVRTQEYGHKFFLSLEQNPQLMTHMEVVVMGTASCSDIEYSVKELLKTLGLPVQTNSYYMTIKQLFERMAPTMIDDAGVRLLLTLVRDSLLGNGDLDARMGLVTPSYNRGLHLLLVLSNIYPETFYGETLFEELISFLKAEDENASDLTIQILTSVGTAIEKSHPHMLMRLIPILQNFVENGTVKQAKHAVACLNQVSPNKERLFGQILDHLKQQLHLESHFFRTAVVSIGHIAYHCPDLFGAQIKSIVSKVIVKDLLMSDQLSPRSSESSWGPYDYLTEETKVKLQGIKMMTRWLLGLKTATQSAISTLRLLSTILRHHGDLMERGHLSEMEKSWMRLSAALAMLKLCQEPTYAEAMPLEHFQNLALVLNDECYEIRQKFGQKLHKHLLSLRLPIDFLAILSLGALEKARELKANLRISLLSNITRRKDFLKQHSAGLTPSKLYSTLPDYVLPYAIHLLAHHPILRTHDDVEALTKIKDCLWFILEPLITKNENYSFSFFKKLIENIKQTKDKQAPDDNIANLKLYAVCDLALGLVLTKTTNFVYKDFPVEPNVPSKLFTDPDRLVVNNKTYLPPELISSLPKKSRFEIYQPRSNNPLGGDELLSSSSQDGLLSTAGSSSNFENGEEQHIVISIHEGDLNEELALKQQARLREMMETRERTAAKQPASVSEQPPSKRKRTTASERQKQWSKVAGAGSSEDSQPSPESSSEPTPSSQEGSTRESGSGPSQAPTTTEPVIIRMSLRKKT